MHNLLKVLCLALAVSTVTLPHGATAVRAVEPDEILTDARLEARARNLSAGLRCLVCQNQSIDDSNAPLARDLRVLVRDRLKAGDTDSQIMDYVVARYGEFVLLRPRFSAATLVLWIAPLLVLAVAIFLAAAVLRGQRRRSQSQERLTQEDQARLAEILRDNAGGRPN